MQSLKHNKNAVKVLGGLFQYHRRLNKFSNMFPSIRIQFEREDCRGPKILFEKWTAGVCCPATPVFEVVTLCLGTTKIGSGSTLVGRIGGIGLIFLPSVRESKESELFVGVRQSLGKI
jgi:hypothetical protein